MPNVVTVAGLTARPAKKLPADLDQIAEASGANGVILASFGSTAHFMPGKVVQRFFDAFAQLNQTVVAKFGVTNDVPVPANVKLVRWLPQNDLLGHPKTRIFITHCGNNGLHETLYHGVPVIGISLFAEQSYNCHRAAEMGYGLKMNIQSFTVDELRRAVEEVLGNTTYRDNIRRMSTIFRDQPQTAREKVVYWIEYVLNYGGAHLRSAALDMELYEWLMLDIIAVVFVVLIVGILALEASLRRVRRLLEVSLDWSTSKDETKLGIRRTK